MQRFCGNIYHQIAQRHWNQRPEAACSYQGCIGGGREKQPVALDEEARPLLGSEIASQDDTEGVVFGMPGFTVESSRGVVGSLTKRQGRRVPT